MVDVKLYVIRRTAGRRVIAARSGKNIGNHTAGKIHLEGCRFLKLPPRGWRYRYNMPVEHRPEEVKYYPTLLGHWDEWSYYYFPKVRDHCKVCRPCTARPALGLSSFLCSDCQEN